MNEQSTSDPQTGMDRVFSSLRGIGIRRRTDDKWVAGVCSGIADRLGIDPVIVRAALVLLFPAGSRHRLLSRRVGPAARRPR